MGKELKVGQRIGLHKFLFDADYSSLRRNGRKGQVTMKNKIKRTTWAKTHREALESLRRQIDFDIVQVAEKIGGVGGDNSILFKDLKRHTSIDQKLGMLETLEEEWLRTS